MTNRFVYLAGLLLLVSLLVVACGPSAAPTPTPRAATPTAAPAGSPAAGGGSAATGRGLFVSKGCGSCHKVAGISEAIGTVGPDLSKMATQATIAGGTLANNTENLKMWLKNPPGVKPGTLMPSLGLSDSETENLVAFLETLK